MFPTAVNAGANTLSANGIPLGTSSWTAAETNFPLPVELLGFTGERQSDTEVMLHWTTATEHNNAGFEVWRMIEGEEDFREVAWVEGAGNSQSMRQYNHSDFNASSATTYYKLKQVDLDGRHEWSPVVAVAGHASRSSLLLYPNPARTEFFTGLASEGGERVLLLDTGGRLVRQWAQGARYELTGLQAGAYTVQVLKEDGGSAQGRLVIE